MMGLRADSSSQNSMYLVSLQQNLNIYFNSNIAKIDLLYISQYSSVMIRLSDCIPGYIKDGFARLVIPNLYRFGWYLRYLKN